MKAALNGALNCSILDGWWAECFTGDNGWAVTSAESVEDLDRRDELEAESLFGLLEQQIVPLFYERDDAGVPQGWVDRVKTGWRTLGPAGHRRPHGAGLHHRALRAAGRAGRAAVVDSPTAGPVTLVAWKARLRAGWRGVHVDRHRARPPRSPTWAPPRRCAAQVSLGSLDEADVEVQLLHGPVGEAGELLAATVEPMVRVEQDRRRPPSLRRPLPARPGRAATATRCGWCRPTPTWSPPSSWASSPGPERPVLGRPSRSPPGSHRRSPARRVCNVCVWRAGTSASPTTWMSRLAGRSSTCPLDAARAGR